MPPADCSLNGATRRSRPARWRGRLGSPGPPSPLFRRQARPVRHARRAARCADPRRDPRRHHQAGAPPHAVVRDLLGRMGGRQPPDLAGDLRPGREPRRPRASSHRRCHTRARDRQPHRRLPGRPVRRASDSTHAAIIPRVQPNRRAQLAGRSASRAEAERLLAETLYALITTVAPKVRGPGAT